jgi:predicted nucleic acid-binding protein
MPGTFLDTSALVKHYHPEVGSAEVDRLWNDPVQTLFVSRLTALEIVSAFAGKVRTKEISVTDFATLRRCFFTDIANKRLTTIRLLVLHFKEAERLLRE